MQPLERNQIELEGYEHAKGKAFRIPQQQAVMAKARVSGKASVVPDEEPPTDLELLARMVDADCRAYHPDLGYHYDSRCLDHLSDAIARLQEVGALDPLDDAMEPQGRRVRTGVVKGENLIADRPMFSPQAMRAMEVAQELRDENAALKAELRATREERDRAAKKGTGPDSSTQEGLPPGDPYAGKGKI